MAGYWHTNYWHTNYWHTDYWAPVGGASVGQYWHSNYWALSTGDAGDIFQTSAPELNFAPLQTQAGQFHEIQATTPGIALTPQNANARLDIDPPVTAPTLSLTPLNPSVATTGYQLGDIDLRWIPDSTITIVQGVIGTAPSLGFSIMSHTIEEGGGINVAASLPELGPFTVFSHDARLDIEVEPIPPAVTFTALNTTAGIGNQIPATQPTLGFSVATHTIVGISVNQGIVGVNNAAALSFTPLNTVIVGTSAAVSGQVVETICIFQDDAIVRAA